MFSEQTPKYFQQNKCRYICSYFVRSQNSLFKLSDVPYNQKCKTCKFDLLFCLGFVLNFCTTEFGSPLLPGMPAEG